MEELLNYIQERKAFLIQKELESIDEHGRIFWSSRLMVIIDIEKKIYEINK